MVGRVRYCAKIGSSGRIETDASCDRMVAFGISYDDFARLAAQTDQMVAFGAIKNFATLAAQIIQMVANWYHFEFLSPPLTPRRCK